MGQHEIIGYYKGKVAMIGVVVLSSDSWSLIMPSTSVPLDLLTIPPMIDFDSILLGVASPSVTQAYIGGTPFVASVL